MNRTVLRELLRHLAERHGWRHRADTHEAFAVHHGVGIHASEDDGQLHFLFFAPGANIGDQILEHFSGFTHCAEAGVPLDWFRGRTTDDHSCTLMLDGERLEEIDEETFFSLPDRVADDFRALGAAESFPCQHCGEHPADDVRLIDRTYHGLCRFCRQLLEVRTVGGALASGLAVRWGPALLRLAAVAVVIGLFWGWLVFDHLGRMIDPERRQGLTVTTAVMLLGGLGFAGAWLTLPRESDVSWGLRAVACASVAFAVAVGGALAIVAFDVRNNPGVNLDMALEHYFTVVLPANFGEQVLFPAACAIGMVIGLTTFAPLAKIGIR